MSEGDEPELTSHLLGDWFFSAPRNSGMLNLWKGFVELVHYFIDENQEWLERELEVCKKLKY